MIELRGISKTYKTNRGKAVQALKNVSIQFPKTGMVFISGKSGCGKSTLLNIIGGLDKADEGEIIIKGKSSRDFTAADFDSYRNTYLGFIFQDYNILEDFSVGANIALAMELQGEKATDQRLNEILSQVGLDDLADRKPSQLSGGQRQRVAIARALVKNPEIIMADEPTGALDSVMGKQVLMTLKKLSADKLVIVISHDLEFAETYGDRIITMSDGEIISDKEKTIVKGVAKDAGVTVIDDSIIQIKKGYKLTSEDLQMINEYLSKNEEDSVISLDSQLNDQMRKISKINSEGDRELFRDTDKEALAARATDYESMRLIKSKLPLKSTIKMALSSMKVKPVRLFFIILLSVVAFGLFGSAITMATYNKDKALNVSLKEGNINYVSFAKQEKLLNDKKTDFKVPALLRSEDISTIKKEFPEKTFVKVLSKKTFFEVGDMTKIEKKPFYAPAISGFTTIDENTIAEFGMSYIGKLPKAKDEIMLTNYTYNVIKETGYINPKDRKTIPILQAKDLIGKEIIISEDNFKKTYKITGIIDTKFPSTIYDSYKKDVDEDENDKLSNLLKEAQMIEVLDTSLEQVAFISPEQFSILDNEPIVYDLFSLSTQLDFEEPQSNHLNDSAFRAFLPFSSANKSNVVFFDKAKQNLEENEVLIPIGMSQAIDIETPNGKQNLGDMLSSVILADEGEMNAEDYKALIRSYAPSIPFNSLKYTFTTMANPTAKPITGQLKVVGFYFKTGSEQNFYTGVLSDQFIKKLNIQQPGKYSALISNMPEKQEDIKKIVDFSFAEKNDAVYPMKNSAAISVDFIDNVVKILLPTFVAIGTLLAIFASVLFMTFIFTSIKYKQHDIGILRAIGARGTDILGIFLSESLIISLINGVLACIIAGVGIYSINRTIDKILQTGITLFDFGIMHIALVLLISIISAAIASFIPVFTISKQKPIDAIRSR
ncbi:MAG: ATP-binding cassette domain-containing protein [Clostridia bacterium]|nr:ATP-binding cassette domain-containing protein [Clostridia bacterium]